MENEMTQYELKELKNVLSRYQPSILSDLEILNEYGTADEAKELRRRLVIDS